MKSLISSDCRRHCLSLMLRFPILFESCLFFMNICLVYNNKWTEASKLVLIDDDPFTWGIDARASFDKAETEAVDGVR